MKYLFTFTTSLLLSATLSFGQDNNCQPLIDAGIFDVVKSYEDGAATYDYQRLFSSANFQEFYKNKQNRFSVVIPTKFGEVKPEASWGTEEWNRVTTLMNDQNFVNSTNRFHKDFYSRTVNESLIKSYVECMKIKNKKFEYNIDVPDENGCEQFVTIGYLTSGKKPKIDQVTISGGNFVGKKIRVNRRLRRRTYKIKSIENAVSTLLINLDNGDYLKVPLKGCTSPVPPLPRPDYWALQIDGGYADFHTAWLKRNSLHGLIRIDPANPDPDIRMRNIEMYYVNSSKTYFLMLYAFGKKNEIESDLVNVKNKFNVNTIFVRNLSDFSIDAINGTLIKRESSGPPAHDAADVTHLIF